MRYEEVLSARDGELSVVLGSGRHGDTVNNPVWNGSFGKVKGYVRYVSKTGDDHDLCVQVQWDCGTSNSYAPKDLVFYHLVAENQEEVLKEPERKVNGLFNL